MLAVFALIITAVQSALLMRDPAFTNSIEVESVHQSQVTTYRFRVKTDVLLSKGNIFTLTFPAEYVPVTTTGCDILTYLPSSTGQPVTYTPCTPEISEFKLKFTLPLKLNQGQTFGLQLKEVKNPTNYLSTGPFKMTVNVYEDSQYFAQNDSFDTLAFFPKLSESYSSMLINTSFASFRNTVGTLSDYAIEITHTSSLFKGSWYRLKLPTGWSKESTSNIGCYIAASSSTASLPEGNFYCSMTGDYVYLKGLSSNIEVSGSPYSTYVLVFTDILNPASATALNAYTFYLDILEEGTSIVIESFRSGSPPIQQGTFLQVGITSNNGSAKYVSGASLLQTITAINTHPIKENGTVTFTLTSGTWDSTQGCYILPGISDYSTSQAATCSISAANKLITLSNLAKIPANTSIKVQAIAILSSQPSDTLLVLSSDSSGNKIDESSITVFPQYTTASKFTSYLVTLSSALVYSSTDLIIQFKPSIQAGADSTMNIEFPLSYAVSSLSCAQKIDLGGYSTLTACSVTGNKITLKLNNIVPTTSDCYVKLSGFTNPKAASNVADVFEFCSDLYQIGNPYPYNSECGTVDVDSDALLPTSSIKSYILVSSSTMYVPYVITISPIQKLDVESTRVEISLPMKTAVTVDVWDTNLGADAIECIFENLSVKSTCRLIPAANTNNGSFATLVLENLGTLNMGTNQVVRTVFKAPKTTTSFSYKMTYGYMENRIYREVASTASISYSTVVAQSGCTTASISSRPFTVIDTSFELELSLTSSGAVSVDDYLVMIFPAGWDVNNISLVLTDSVGIKNLVKMPNSYAPAVIGQVTNSGGIKNTANSGVTISRLFNPRKTAYASTKSIHIGVASSAFASRCYGATTNNLALSDIGSLTVSAKVDVDMQGFPGATYSFTVKTEHSVPAQGKIKITLPIAFSDFSNLVVTSSALTYDSEDLQYTRSAQILSLNNLAALQANSIVTVHLANLKNPSSSLVGSFSVETSDKDSNTIDSVSGLSVSLPNSFSKGTISVKSVTMDPNIAKATNADFFLKFRSSMKLPKNSIIEVTTPKEYFDLPSGSCNLNYYITSCITTGHYITVNINQEIPASTDILLSINGLFSVPAVDTDYFYIRALYNGLVINESGKSKDAYNYFSPYVSSSTSSITLEEINFYPKNQGEPATYSFSMSIDKELSNEHSIIIWYPSQFDPTLTMELEDINCWADPIVFVGSNLSCTVTGYRKVVVTGHNTLPANLPFTIYMSNIRNPTKGKIGQFRGAIQDESSNTILYIVKAGSLWMLTTPKPILLKDISSEYSYARILNTFSFQFGFSTNLPSDQNKGRIWIDFPSDFLLVNPNTQRGWEYPCTAYLVNKFSKSSTPWSSSLSCVNFNSNRIEVRGAVEIIAEPNTSLLLSISQVPGPQTDSITQPIKISTYDGVSGMILDRTFELLSYPLTFQLDIKGEELIVNENGAITVPRGTCSDDVSIQTVSTQSPMKVYLKIVGTISSIPSTSFYPDDTLLFPISQTSLDFKVCIPYNAAKGSYVLEFNKNGDDLTEDNIGDEIYAEIQSVILVVTEEQSFIHVSSEIELPVPGHSYPIDIVLERSPHSELFVTPRLTTGTSEGIIFEPEYVLFEKGEYSKQIVIHSTSAVKQQNYSLVWDITGKDADSYTVPDDSSMKIIGIENIIPVIEAIDYSSTRRSVDFSIKVSEAGVLYYQIELGDYQQPSPTAIVENYRVNKANRVSIYDTRFMNSLTISDLAAETTYVLYATLQDRSDNLSNLYKLTFSTSKDYPSVKFVIDFEEFDPRNESSQSTLEEVIMPQLAKALAIKPERLSFYSVVYEENVSRRQLQSSSSESIDTSNFSDYALIVQVANDKYSDMISPKEIVDSTTIDIINHYLTQDGLAIKDLSKSYTMANSLPKWYEDVNVWDTSKDSITIVARLRDEGYVHILVLDVGSTPPTPQQIVWGLDGQGNPARHAYSYYDGITAAVFVTYEGLSSDTPFDVYVSATSNYPGNNKSVVEENYSFPKVRTELDEVCSDCDKYMEVDETGALLSVGAIFTYLALMA